MAARSKILAHPMERGAWWAIIHWATKNRIQLSDTQTLEKYSEIQRNTVKYHLTPVRMVIIEKSINNKCWRKRHLHTLLM